MPTRVDGYQPFVSKVLVFSQPTNNSFSYTITRKYTPFFPLKMPPEDVTAPYIHTNLN